MTLFYLSFHFFFKNAGCDSYIDFTVPLMVQIPQLENAGLAASNSLKHLKLSSLSISFMLKD